MSENDEPDSPEPKMKVKRKPVKRSTFNQYINKHNERLEELTEIARGTNLERPMRRRYD